MVVVSLVLFLVSDWVKILVMVLSLVTCFGLDCFVIWLRFFWFVFYGVYDFFLLLKKIGLYIKHEGAPWYCSQELPMSGQPRTTELIRDIRAHEGVSPIGL